METQNSNQNQKLKIMQIAPFAFPVGNTARYGGIEQVINDLDGQLIKTGHESFVVATADSRIRGKLLPSFERGLWIEEEDKSQGWKYKKEKFDYDQKLEEHSKRALEYIREIKPEVIHDHFGFIKSKVFKAVEKELPPILYTLHDPIDSKSKRRLQRIKEINPKKIFFNAISYSQKRFFEDFVSIDYMVYNAIPISEYSYSSKGEGFVFHLGLLNKPKGTDIALDVAKEIGKKIIIAGPILTGRVHEKKHENRQGAVGGFWEDEIKPRLDLIIKEEISPSEIDSFIGDFMNSKYNSVYIGELNKDQKREWYRRAEAFYFPIRREEPFGLVMIESMACGTPVIAYGKGAIPEVVVDGKTGYVVKPDFNGPDGDVTGHHLEITKNGFDAFVDAASKVDDISRRSCRKHVENCFTIERQTKDYLNVYKDMIYKT